MPQYEDPYQIPKDRTIRMQNFKIHCFAFHMRLINSLYGKAEIRMRLTTTQTGYIHTKFHQVQ